MFFNCILALEFMLNRLYESSHVAMICLHPNADTENYEAYVKLHLSSEKSFQWNVRE